MLINMIMPKMGESIMECTVIAWLRQPGDRIEVDESVLEVATDKVDTEVPASHNGILKEWLVKESDVVAIGAPFARIEVDVEEAVLNDSEPDTTGRNSAESHPIDADQTPAGIGDVANVAAQTVVAEEPKSEIEKAARELEVNLATLSSRSVPEKAVAASPTRLASTSDAFPDRFYSPLVLTIAREESISRDELDRIHGSGAGNRVTKKDILAYLIDRAEGREHGAQAVGHAISSTEKTTVSTPDPLPAPRSMSSQTGTPLAATSVNGQTDIIQMDRMRKMIAQRMVESKQISPHVSSFVEADMTNLVAWRTQAKEAFKQTHGENLTFTPLLIDAIVRAIQDFPMINVSVEGDTILVKKSINIGVAVALPNGNLIVPVIHNADQYNVVGLTKKVNDLTRRARENKLTADDLAGGTYTISNIGTFGNLMGTPIILQPQVAIMAFGAIVKKPAVIETPQGDFIGIRHLMFLSHSYDHRVVDGSLGGQFVKRVADYLEKSEPTL